jgi:hypothetical protein
MANLELQMIVGRRWFFWPCIVTTAVLAELGLFRDIDPVVAWLARHALSIKVG